MADLYNVPTSACRLRPAYHNCRRTNVCLLSGTYRAPRFQRQAPQGTYEDATGGVEENRERSSEQPASQQTTTILQRTTGSGHVSSCKEMHREQVHVNGNCWLWNHQEEP